VSPKRKQSPPGGAALPSFGRVPLARILEPALPARATMDTAKMDELVESMRAIGQIEPVTLELHEGMFELITGHRRYLAARSLGWPEISALVYEEGAPSKLALMLHENTMREDLNPAEEALWMAQAKEQLELDEAGLVKMFQRSAEYVGQRFQLLRGDPEIFASLQRGEIRVGVARELNRVTDAATRAYYLDAAKRADPPMRVVHRWVVDWLAQEGARQGVMAQGGVAAPGSQDVHSRAGSVGESGGAPSQGAQGAPPASFGCQLCGGDRDPYNLIDVRLHKWEWEQIVAQVAKAARGN